MHMSPMTPVATPTYFAVEVKTKFETAHDLAKVVLMAAKDIGLLFLRLEAMDLIEVGSMKLMRFRTDLTPATPLVDALFEGGRAVISLAATGGYGFRSKTKTGPVPSSTLLAIPRAAGVKTFRGTKIKLWERQFDSDVAG